MDEARLFLENRWNAGKDVVAGGGSTFLYPDTSGAMHSFSTSQIEELGNAVENYYYALFQAMATAQAGGTPSWPSNSVQLQ